MSPSISLPSLPFFHKYIAFFRLDSIFRLFKQFVNSERASEVFSSTTKTLSVSLSKSVQVGHFYRELHNKNRRNSIIKILLRQVEESQLELIFCGGKTTFTHAIAVNKTANSDNFKMKNLNSITITYLAIHSLNRGKSSYIN